MFGLGSVVREFQRFRLSLFVRFKCVSGGLREVIAAHSWSLLAAPGKAIRLLLFRFQASEECLVRNSRDWRLQVTPNGCARQLGS